RLKMSNVPMPEPVGFLHICRKKPMVRTFSFREKSKELAVRGYFPFPVITTTQAKAYADARVKEVLEEAQRILTGMYTEAVKARVPEDEDEEGYNQGLLERALALTDATLQIRALIPPTNPPA